MVPPEPDVEDWVRTSLEDGVPEALELHLQPVVHLGSGAIYGAESFIRWRAPSGEVLATSAWLPHAHATGALTDCARSMLSRWAATSRGADGPIVSFNLMGDQMLDGEFMDDVLAIPADCAAGLAIEIHQLQFDVERANAVQPQWSWLEVPEFDAALDELRSHGFSLWVDDFGDGSDDVAVIEHESVDVVKLDRVFLDVDPADLAATVAEVHRHDKVALLECIETEDDVARAVAAEVDLGQGFRFAPGLTAQEFADFGGRNRT